MIPPFSESLRNKGEEETQQQTKRKTGRRGWERGFWGMSPPAPGALGEQLLHLHCLKVKTLEPETASALSPRHTSEHLL